MIDIDWGKLKIKPADLSMAGKILFGAVIVKSHLESPGGLRSFFAEFPVQVRLSHLAPVDTGQLRPSMRVTRTETKTCFKAWDDKRG